MLGYDEKRDFIRMNVDCDLTYCFAESDQENHGRCTSLSGAGISFVASQSIALGKSLKINVIPKNALTPPMTAFIEVVRCNGLEGGEYEIAGSIKSIKGT